MKFFHYECPVLSAMFNSLWGSQTFNKYPFIVLYSTGEAQILPLVSLTSPPPHTHQVPSPVTPVKNIS